jgi:hypothetical protein
MDSTGWLFVPKNSADGQPCRLIVILHGCLQYQGIIQQQLVQNPASMSGPTRTTSWSFIRKPRRPRPIHWDAGIGGDTPAPIMRSRVRRKIDAIMTMVAQITSGYTPAK